MLSSATSRKGKPDADLHPVQKPSACSCQQQAGRESQMLTYTLFKNPEHALVSNKQEGPAIC